MRPDPYIGITGFTNSTQVDTMVGWFDSYMPIAKPHRLHIGAMTNRKIIRDIPSPWDTVFPKIQDLASIFHRSDTYNCLHYADYGSEEQLPKYLSTAIMYGGHLIHAVQLDMTWPDAGEVAEAVHRSRKKIEVILQIGRKAFDQINNDPGDLVQMLVEFGYTDVISRVLLDKSMGEGRLLDTDGLRPFIKAIYDLLPGLGVVVAGGLGPGTMHLVRPLINEFPDLSIDAQARLCKDGGAENNPLDTGLARQYLEDAVFQCYFPGKGYMPNIKA